MRRTALALFAVIGLLLTFVAPVAADTGPPVSGTLKYLSSSSVDCAPQGARTTCTETGVDVFPEDGGTVVVCTSVYTYTFSERTGRGRQISYEQGCTEPIDASALTITVSGDQMTAALAPTQITLAECRRTCTETRTVTVSASDTGGPVAKFTNRSTSRDGTCTFRYTESGQSAPVSGTITIDGTAIAESGFAQQSEVKVTETCK
jgi:hypothetical protein